MSSLPNRGHQRSGRVLATLAVLLLAGSLVTGEPGHAADLAVTSTRITVDVVGNPP